MLLYSILFLFFFQLIADFVEAIYAFGLLGVSIPVEIVSLLFLFSPLLLLFLKKGLGKRALLSLSGVMVVARLAEVLLDTRGKLLVSGLGVSCFMLLLPAMFYHLQRSQEGRENHHEEHEKDHAGREMGVEGAQIGAGLALAVALSILLRILNSGNDLSSAGGFQVIAWILGAVAIIQLNRRLREPSPTPPTRQSTPAPTSRVTVLNLGLVGVLVLLYFAFTSPNVIARWTGASYTLVVTVIALALAVFAWTWAGRRPSLPLLWSWNIAFVLALVLTILPHQIAFPADPGAYPLAEPPTSQLVYIPMLVMLALSPVILLDFSLLVQELLSLRLSPRSLGIGFSLAALYVLIMIFAHVFTTVYDYIPVVGPVFRDRFWLVYLVASLVAVLPLLKVRATQRILPPSALGYLPLAVLIVTGGAVLGVFAIQPRPAPPSVENNSIRVMTYNLQQGYSEDGQKSFDQQIEEIRKAGPDLVGLQETDTNRIAGGNNDLVGYFAKRLEMHSYYGPKTVAGTFGIALLSRYPIVNRRTFYMYSLGEQTATIHAQVLTGGKALNIFVTHLGNGGPIVQQENILAETAGLENVILMGDFNFRPDTEQYALTRQQLDDAWLLRWPSGIDDSGLNPTDRIDHIFVSPGLQVTQAEYILSPASDHPAVVVEVKW